MSRTTFQSAIAELHALLGDDETFAPVTALANAGCVRALPYEPGATGWAKPCTVTVSPEGIDPTDWRISVRVYVDAGQAPATAQNLLIDVTVAVGNALRDGAAYGPDEWQFTYSPDLDAWVGLSTVRVGREDGF